MTSSASPVEQLVPVGAAEEGALLVESFQQPRTPPQVVAYAPVAPPATEPAAGAAACAPRSSHASTAAADGVIAIDMGSTASPLGQPSRPPAPPPPPLRPPPLLPPRARSGVRRIDSVTDRPPSDCCAKLGCPADEKRCCCAAFWLDDGVPPVWPLSWLMARHNPYLNDNALAERIGRLGLRLADRERRLVMGVALGLTATSAVLTTYGCLSLSTNPELARPTAWAIGYVARRGRGVVAYVGLARLVVSTCEAAPPGVDWLEWAECSAAFHRWADVPAGCAGRDADAAEPYGYPCGALLACAEQAVANQFGAAVTAATLLFALAGCLTRIRRRADTNLFKAIGVLPDALGTLTLGVALITFGSTCTAAMPQALDSTRVGALTGPGYTCYLWCWIVGLARLAAHCVVPVPGTGLDVGRAARTVSRRLSTELSAVRVSVASAVGSRVGSARNSLAASPRTSPRASPRPRAQPSPRPAALSPRGPPSPAG